MSARHKDEGPTVAAVALHEQNKADSRHSAKVEDVGQGFRAMTKREADAVARAALLGLALDVTPCGGWSVTTEAGAVTKLASLQAAEGLVYACELVAGEVAALMVTRRLATA